jgi:prophage antirepressor-like protein
MSKQIKIENWNGHDIRFIWHKNDWWAVAADVANALNYSQTANMLRKVKQDQKGLHLMNTPGGKQEVSIISEKGIYAVIMRSRRKEAEAFQDWVFEVIKALRQATGLEGFQIFRMLDKEHQQEAMDRLKEGLSNPIKVDYIKANTIANKAVSSLHGYRKMVKKRDMPPDMLVQRQKILDDTVNLMTTNESFGLGLSVSKTVYGKYLC